MTKTRHSLDRGKIHIKLYFSLLEFMKDMHSFDSVKNEKIPKMKVRTKALK